MRSWEKKMVDVPELGDSTKYGYAQCVTAGNLVFIAGQTGVDEEYKVVSPDFGSQARQALENVRLALEAAEATPRGITSMTVFLTDMRYGHEFLEIRKEVLGDELPASAVIGVSQLVFPELLVEVQAIAVLSEA